MPALFSWAVDAFGSYQSENGRFLTREQSIVSNNGSAGTLNTVDSVHAPAAGKREASESLYYGYRFYNPGTGRWLRRDPLEEQSALNLNGFAENDPIQKIDPLGLTTGTISVLFSDPVNKFGHAGWSIRLRWTPPKEWTCCDRCTKVVWVQSYSSILRKTSLGIPVSQDWTKDWDETDYVGNSELWDCTRRPRGHEQDNVDMWDDPEIYSVTWATAKSMDFMAESRVKCVEGADKGKIYGGVLWGYLFEVVPEWPIFRVTGGVKGIW